MKTHLNKTRQEIKANFLRDVIPTDSGFSDLLNGHLNQAEDGVIKPPDQALSIVRKNPTQPVVRFFGDSMHADFSWQIRLTEQAKPTLWISSKDGQASLSIDHATGNLGLGGTTTAARITVHSNLYPTETSIDPQSKLTYGGYVVLKDSNPQLDFIDIQGSVDWAVQVKDGNMSFVRSPWDTSMFSIAGPTGYVGIGTSNPSQRLHVNGTAAIKTLYVDELRIAGQQILQGGPFGLGVTESLEGNIGISETEPAARLSISSDLDMTKTLRNPKSSLLYGGHVSIQAPAPQLDFIDVEPGGVHPNWAIHVEYGKMFFVRPPWRYDDLVLDGLGNVGIGTADPISKLHVEGLVECKYLVIDNFWKLGGINQQDDWLRLLDPSLKKYDDSITDYFGGFQAHKLWSTQGYAQGSDIRLKVLDSISPIGDAMPKVVGLKPVEFRYKSDSDRKNSLLGFIAQDVQVVCPQAVVVGADGMKGIDEGCLVALLVQSLKEQQAKIENLRKLITSHL
jgi:hypothetical protein